MLIKLEEIFCTLGQAKKLKELGVKQSSHFYWHIHKEFRASRLVSAQQKYFSACQNVSYDYYSAFGVAELGEMIGSTCNEWAQGWSDCSDVFNFQFGSRGSGYMLEQVGVRFTSGEKTEAAARADLLIYIIENRLCSVEIINRGFKNKYRSKPARKVANN